MKMSGGGWLLQGTPETAARHFGAYGPLQGGVPPCTRPPDAVERAERVRREGMAPQNSVPAGATRDGLFKYARKYAR